MGASGSAATEAPKQEAPAAAAPAAAAAAEPAAAEHPEKKRMAVMTKHLNENLGQSEEHQKQWMAHFGVNAEGDIINKKKHDAAVAGFVGAVDAEGNLVDKEKFAAACEKIKAKYEKGEKGEGKAKAKAKGKAQAQQAQGSKICVRNLPDDVTGEKLKEMFASYGTVGRADLKTKEDGKSKGFGFVAFSSADEANKAIAGMNDKEMGGKKLAVSLAYDNQDAKGKGKGKDGKGVEKGKGKGKGNKGGWTSGQQMDAQTYQAQMQAYQAYQMQAYQMAQYQYGQQMQAWYAQVGAAASDPNAAAAGALADGQKQYLGEMKRNAHDGYGFITCEELKGKWIDAKNPEGRDIYIAADLIPEGCKTQGSKVKFTLVLNAKGHPAVGSCVAA